MVARRFFFNRAKIMALVVGKLALTGSSEGDGYDRGPSLRVDGCDTKALLGVFVSLSRVLSEVIRNHLSGGRSVCGRFRGVVPFSSLSPSPFPPALWSAYLSRRLRKWPLIRANPTTIVVLS